MLDPLRWCFGSSNPLVSLLSGALIVAGFAATSQTPFWALHNVIKGFIAINVARVVQLGRLPFIVLALLGLACYDVLAVYGTQQFTDGGTSIMEAVARARVGLANSGAESVATVSDGDSNWSLDQVVSAFLTLPIWRPGLFAVSLNGRVTDGLGLGDVIFPSILSTWAVRYDKSAAKPSQAIYPSTVFGFVLGLLLCEVFQIGQGQPALLFIVPSMLTSVLFSGLISSQLPAMWNYNPETNQESTDIVE